MEEVLDEDFIYELGDTITDSKGSGLLGINLRRWQEELYRLERKINLGCVWLIFFTFILMFFLMIGGLPAFPFFLIFAIGGIIYKRYQAKRFQNLLAHGLYEYEVYDDKIVRYSDRWFKRFYNLEITEIKKHNFGILIIRKKQIRNLLLSDKNEEIIIIPNKTRGYNQVADYLLKRNH